MPEYVIDYFPPVLRENGCFIAFSAGLEDSFGMLRSEISSALSEQFLATMSDYGLERWETLLGLGHEGLREERVFGVLSTLTDNACYTLPALHEMLTSLCGANGYRLVLDGSGYALTVLLGLPVKQYFTQMRGLLRRVAPANLSVTLDYDYNRYEHLAPFTHNVLGAWTHDDIRKEAIF